MLNRRLTLVVTICATLILGLSGCSRTVGDVARWKANGNIEKLIEALEDPKSNVRRNATEALGELQAEAAAIPLAALFNDPEPDIQRKSVEALVRIKSRSTIEPLMDALQLPPPELRTLAARGLGTLRAISATEALISALDDHDETVQCAAATALGQIGAGQAVTPLATKLGDRSAKLRSAAIEALVAIGTAGTPAMLTALKDENDAVRRGALSVLEKTGMAPTSGTDWAWFQLARISIHGTDQIDRALVDQLSNQDGLREILLEAAGHRNTALREHAFFALENRGQSEVAAAIQAATHRADPVALSWFNGRSTWSGAPNWRLDLWGALTALNPDFPADRTAIPPLIHQLNNPAQAQTAHKKLIQAGARARLPLIAALTDDNEPVARHAAEILGERNDPAAEPIWIKLYPDANRAIHVFERHYPEVRVYLAEHLDSAEPVAFRLGYIRDGKTSEAEISFAQNPEGDWVPTPPLPAHLQP